jgi:hypothetical protein
MRRKQIELNGMDGSTVKDGFERNMCTIKTDILFFKEKKKKKKKSKFVRCCKMR